MKKCLVLDLDNTLWGGIVGEDGFDGINLSLTSPGNSFMAFQQAILDLHDRGVILAINSRNNFEDALKVIREHPNMILKEHHFSALRINWNDKALNIAELAAELNIGLDSMVFLDDDKTNRLMVRSIYPSVEVPELPDDPKEYTKFLQSLNYFSSEVLTDEDKMRGNLYVTERLRREAEKQYTNHEDYLKELGLELQFFEDDASCLPRLSQLSDRTNQFNILKSPLTEDDIGLACNSKNQKVFYGKLIDIFGDYGVIIFALIDIKEDEWHIRSLLMSCRVFGRSVEVAFVGKILERAKEEGAKTVSIAFEQSLKNAPACDFINKYFTNYKRLLGDSFELPNWIKMKYENI